MDHDLNLIIIASSYPYGNGESFLDGEIKYLSKVFGRIYIVLPEKSTDILETHPQFSLPSNVSVIPIHNKYTSFHKFVSLFHIFSKKFIRAVRAAGKRDGVKFSWQLAKNILAYIAKDIGFRHLLIKELRSRKIDLSKTGIYSYWINEYTFSLVHIKKQFPDAKVFSRAHGWDVYYERHEIPYLPFREFILPALDGVYPVSENASRYLREKSLNKDSKIFTKYLGVGHKALSRFDPQKGKITILSLSFLSPVKNVEDLVKALELIPSDIEACWYHIGGGDKYAEKIYELAKNKLGSKENIKYEFLGTMDRRQIDDFMGSHSIDLLINTSHFEGIPVSMMEAMSFGIPVVGPNVGGVSELISNGSNGFLLKGKSDPGELRSILIHYAGLSHDNVLLLRKSAFDTWKTKFNENINYTDFAETLYKEIQNNNTEHL